MTTPWLHGLDALEALADGPPPARDWANARLALRAPERVVHLPSASLDAQIAVALGARGAVEQLLAAVDRADDAVIDALGWSGQLPEDREPWVRALQARAATADDDELPVLARALCDLGGLDGALLGRVARLETRAARMAVPALVLRWAAEQGRPLDPLAREVAGTVFRGQVDALTFLRVSAGLGLPKLATFGDDAAHDARLGAERAGKVIELPSGKGSASRRPDRIVRGLLDGAGGPAAAWLRAVAAIPGDHARWLCSLAGWLSAYEPDPNPVHAVTWQAGGEDRVLRAAARRALTADDAPEVVDALQEAQVEPAPASALALKLLAIRVPEADALAEELVATPDLSRLAVPIAALGHLPRRSWPAWTERQHVRALILRYLPTEETLTELLDAPPAADGEERRLRAWALAEMADPAAYTALLGEVAAAPDDPVVAEARAHGAALLGRD